jgi:AraC family transcriptional regulator
MISQAIPQPAAAPFPAAVPFPAATAPTGEPDVTALLLAWQSTGDPDAFAAIAAAVTPTIESTASLLLRRRGRVDATLVADVVSLVLDHLRRLAVPGPGERPVAAFRPVPGAGRDAGLVYLRWLTRSRSSDLLRSQRRRDRHEPSFPHRFGPLAERSAAVDGAAPAREEPAESPEAPELNGRLDGIDRAVAEAILRGESQVDIARRLGISEGTVTRRRQRLTARLGRQARDDGDGFAPGRRPGPDRSGTAPAIVTFVVTVAGDRWSEFPLPRQVHTLSMLLRGRGAQLFVRGGERRTIDRRPGGLAFVAAGAEPGTLVADDDEPLECVFVVIPPEVVAAECGGAAETPRLRDEPDFRDPCLEQLLARLADDTTAGPPAGECPAPRILRRLLVLQGLPVGDDGEAASRLSPAEREQLVDWIDGHLDRPLPLAHLAGLFGLSVGHFARKVRNTFRLCPSRLVQQRRAIAAMALLADHAAPLSALASRLGFASQSHFTTMFRRHVGLTPAVFRQKVHGGSASGMARRIPAVARGRAQDGVPAGVEKWMRPAGSTAGWRG